jgi:hypothetical protein
LASIQYMLFCLCLYITKFNVEWFKKGETLYGVNLLRH